MQLIILQASYMIKEAVVSQCQKDLTKVDYAQEMQS